MLVFVGTLAGTLGGCANADLTTVSMTSAQSGTVAFDSVDGAPSQVFDRLVYNIDIQARGRNLAVVARETPASYRVRSYIAAQVSHGRTTIAWVWDVYDANQQRALRLSGAEPAGKAGHDPWANADDQVIRRIAQAGVDGLADWLNAGAPASTPAPAAPASPTDPDGAAVASADDPSQQATTSVASLDRPALGFTAR